ncbi:hypothetical protein ACIBL3_32125 [Kribbella sp. NPDC050124]|uniref:hypothetical protein n=1 Tax=Kribbella sp. NPDC050124 TaxID=3364114 RepID=UPI003794C99C
MTTFSFKIILLNNGRYAWMFVQRRKGGNLRILARSGRDYSTRKKARVAVKLLKKAIKGAKIEDDTSLFSVTHTEFVIRDTVPLHFGGRSNGSRSVAART